MWQSMGWTSGVGILVEFLDTRCLEEGETRFASSLLWLSPAPPRVDAFCLLVVSKVSTVDNLSRRSMTAEYISNVCVLYAKEGVC